MKFHANKYIGGYEDGKIAFFDGNQSVLVLINNSWYTYFFNENRLEFRSDDPLYFINRFGKHLYEISPDFVD